MVVQTNIVIQDRHISINYRQEVLMNLQHPSTNASNVQNNGENTEAVFLLYSGTITWFRSTVVLSGVLSCWKAMLELIRGNSGGSRNPGTSINQVAFSLKTPAHETIWSCCWGIESCSGLSLAIQERYEIAPTLSHTQLAWAVTHLYDSSLACQITNESNHGTSGPSCSTGDV